MEKKLDQWIELLVEMGLGVTEEDVCPMSELPELQVVKDLMASIAPLMFYPLHRHYRMLFLTCQNTASMVT